MTSYSSRSLRHWRCSTGVEVSEEDWGIARVIMRNSHFALQRVRDDQRRRAQGTAQAAGRHQAQRNATAREVEESLEREKAIDKTARRIARHVQKHAPGREQGHCVKKCAKNGLSQASLLQYFDAAVSLAAERDWIKAENVDGKKRLLPGAVQPQVGGMG
jgi:hypothetical protein